jgi:DNA-binding NarL/FixJ family response regulator
MRHIVNQVHQLQPNAEIVEAKSYSDGLRHVMSGTFDFLLLDMSLPTFNITQEEDGYQVDPYSGRNILAEMKRKHVQVKTAVITMFETFGEGTDLMTLDELDQELRQEYPDNYCTAIYYNSSEVNWKEALKHLLEPHA